MLLINTISFLFYGLDKFKAIKKSRRISEKFLFGLSFMGGSLGCLLGMAVFRHKIRKVKFYLWNVSMLFLWLFLNIRFGL